MNLTNYFTIEQYFLQFLLYIGWINGNFPVYNPKLTILSRSESKEKFSIIACIYSLLITHFFLFLGIDDTIHIAVNINVFSKPLITIAWFSEQILLISVHYISRLIFIIHYKVIIQVIQIKKEISDGMMIGVTSKIKTCAKLAGSIGAIFGLQLYNLYKVMTGISGKNLSSLDLLNDRLWLQWLSTFVLHLHNRFLLMTCGTLTLVIMSNWLLNGLGSICWKLEARCRCCLFKQLGKTVGLQDEVKLALDIWKLKVAFNTFNKIAGRWAILVIIGNVGHLVHYICMYLSDGLNYHYATSGIINCFLAVTTILYWGQWMEDKIQSIKDKLEISYMLAVNEVSPSVLDKATEENVKQILKWKWEFSGWMININFGLFPALGSMMLTIVIFVVQLKMSDSIKP